MWPYVPQEEFERKQNFLLTWCSVVLQISTMKHGTKSEILRARVPRSLKRRVLKFAKPRLLDEADIVRSAVAEFMDRKEIEIQTNGKKEEVAA